MQSATINEPSQLDSLDSLDFAKLDGLLPAIVQDSATGQVLMLGFLNEQSWQLTQQSGYVTFWSRTRQQLWRKGETSGNRLRVVGVSTDCDQDTLLFQVQVEGDGLVCHEGTVGCFTRDLGELANVTAHAQIADEQLQKAGRR